MGLLDNQTQQDYYSGNDFGGYQFTSLDDIINQFIIIYVGENKIISKIKRTDVAFHAQRAMQELSFDTFKSIKSQEITLPASNTMMLPQDYVNYTKICWVDGNGIERPLYPTKHTSNPLPILQNSDGEYKLEITATLTSGSVNIELDDIYPNVARRMRVTGPSIPEDMFIYSHDDNTAGDKSLIVLRDLNNNAFAPLASTTEVLTFSTPNGVLLSELEDGVSIMGGTATTGFDTTTGSNILTLEPNSTQSISDIEEGMLAFSFSTDIVPEGTTVIQIDTTNNVIFLSNPINTGSDNVGFMFVGNNKDSTTWNNYKSDTSNSTGDANGYNHDTDIYDLNIGQRYGVDPMMAQGNGTYYIDNLKGLIHFSSNVSGENVILKYISDGLGTDEEMIVHKFAEEAMYKSIAYAILSTTTSGQVLVPRFKKEKFAAIRQAKLRLSNIKLEELTQIMRGKSKWIKH
tara:strand:- start:7547 stop:8923 length:1377 start_codon:yes stop_codon:yes gene_type:complete